MQAGAGFATSRSRPVRYGDGMSKISLIAKLTAADGKETELEQVLAAADFEEPDSRKGGSCSGLRNVVPQEIADAEGGQTLGRVGAELQGPAAPKALRRAILGSEAW